MVTYEKTDWHTGDIISLSNMQKIENQLELVTPPATGAIRYDISQNLTEEEQTQAKVNLNFYDFYPMKTITSSGTSNAIVLQDAAEAPLPILNFTKSLVTDRPFPGSDPFASQTEPVTPENPNHIEKIEQITITEYKPGSKVFNPVAYFNSDDFTWTNNSVSGSSLAFQYAAWTPPSWLIGQTIAVNAISNNGVGRYTSSQSDTPYYITKLYGTNSLYGTLAVDSNTVIWFEANSGDDEEVISISDISIIWSGGTTADPNKTVINLSEPFYCGKLDLIKGTLQTLYTPSFMGIPITNKMRFFTSKDLIITDYTVEADLPIITCTIPTDISAQQVTTPAQSMCSHYTYTGNYPNSSGVYYLTDIGSPTVPAKILIADTRFTDLETVRTILQNDEDPIQFGVVVNLDNTINIPKLNYKISPDVKVLELSMSNFVLAYYVDLNATIEKLKQAIIDLGGTIN